MKLFLKKEFLSIFFPVLFFLMIMTGSISIYVFIEQKRIVLSSSAEYYSDYLFQRSTLMQSTFLSSISDLNFLSRHRSVINYLDDSKNKQILIEDMKLFAQENWDYKQIRFIDKNGKEQIRINWHDQELQLVADSLLQDKSDRSYFKKTIQLNRGEVYVSPIDLNVDNGKIEQPYQRVVRFATPVYNDKSELIGIIVINQYLNDFFEQLKIRDNENIASFMLLDSDGYWLIGPNRFRTFGFMFDDMDQLNFHNYYPEIWNEIKKYPYGSIQSESGLFVYRELKINGEYENGRLFDHSNIMPDEKNHWLLLTYLDYRDIPQLQNIKDTFRFVLILSFLFILSISFIISRLWYRERLYVQELNTINKSLERKVAERTDELVKKNEKLNLVNEELESFSYSVSHDLRAPLRHISGFVDLLIKKNQHEITGKGSTYLGYIKDASADMARLIEDLLNFSRIGRAEMKEQSFNLNSLIKECVHILGIDNPQLKIEWHIAEMPQVTGDFSLLKQVWINLLGNAVKYSSKKAVPVIEIDVKEEKAKFIFSIKDNGVGFDMKYQHKLFGTFQRLHSAEEYEGTGIGLAIVRRVIIRHDGQVWAEGEPDQGATFYFSLPKK